MFWQVGRIGARLFSLFFILRSSRVCGVLSLTGTTFFGDTVPGAANGESSSVVVARFNAWISFLLAHASHSLLFPTVTSRCSSNISSGRGVVWQRRGDGVLRNRPRDEGQVPEEQGEAAQGERLKPNQLHSSTASVCQPFFLSVGYGTVGRGWMDPLVARRSFVGGPRLEGPCYLEFILQTGCQRRSCGTPGMTRFDARGLWHILLVSRDERGGGREGLRCAVVVGLSVSIDRSRVTD